MLSASCSPADIQRTERTLCIVDPTLTGEGGHSLAYNLLLARLATSFSRVEIFADKGFRAKTCAQPHAQPHVSWHASLNGLRLHNLQARLGPWLGKLKRPPTFAAPLDFRFSAKDAWAPTQLPFLLAKRLRALDLSFCLRRLVKARLPHTRELHLLFQNAGMEELFCLESLHRLLKAHAHTFRVHLLFRHAPQRTCARVATLARLAHMLQQQGTLPYVHMYTDTEALSAAFHALVQLPGQFKTLPVPFLIPQLPPQRHPGTFRLGMLGPPRMEKGFGFLPTLLGILPAKAGERPLELLVQTEASGGSAEVRAAMAMLEAYAQNTPSPEALKLCLLPGPLDAKAYASCFATLDCALALHASPKYAASSSGIFVEALHLGVPSIVFAGTWMGKLICQAATEGLHIGLCVETLGEVPAAVERIAQAQAAFSEAIAKYLLSNAWRFSPTLLAQTLFGQAGPAEGNGANPC